MQGSTTGRFSKVDLRLATYLLAIPVIILYCITLTGCTSNSPGLQNIFVLQLTYGTPGQLRVGYFGICSNTEEEFACVLTVGTTPETLARRLNDARKSNSIIPDLSSNDEMLALAVTLQTKIILCISIAAAVLFVVALLPLLIVKRWLKKSVQSAMPNNERRLLLLSKSMILMLWQSFGLMLAATVGVSQSTSALQRITTGDFVAPVQVRGGTTLQVLQWLTVAFSFLFAIGISSMFSKDKILMQGGTPANKDMDMLMPPAMPMAGGLTPPPGPAGPIGPAAGLSGLNRI